jgi:hypothetical protein
MDRRDKSPPMTIRRRLTPAVGQNIPPLSEQVAAVRPLVSSDRKET